MTAPRKVRKLLLCVFRDDVLCKWGDLYVVGEDEYEEPVLLVRWYEGTTNRR